MGNRRVIKLNTCTYKDIHHFTKLITKTILSRDLFFQTKTCDIDLLKWNNVQSDISETTYN